MKSFLILSLVLISFVSSAKKKCKEGENFCSKCDKENDVCYTCQYPSFLFPDENGGCTPKKKCVVGLNFCDECNKDNTKCSECMEDYYPDKVGGCSYTDRCNFSYLGSCLKCIDDHRLFGDGKFVRVCMSENSEIYMNCAEIDANTGFCKTCNEGYHLNKVDKKCIEAANCDISIYGDCIQCSQGYILFRNEKKNRCQLSNSDAFAFCDETEDGKTCSKCQAGYYLGEDGKCCNTNYCSASEKLKCTECIKNYYLTKDGLACVRTKHCATGDKDIGYCLTCNNKYYMDHNDKRKCKSNQEDDDLKYCTDFYDKCLSCMDGYILSADDKCSYTKDCLAVEAGLCTKCKKGLFLSEDKRCIKVENCKVTNPQNYTCEECLDGYNFDEEGTECVKEEEEEEEEEVIIKNCIKKDPNNSKKCIECDVDYYLARNINECVSNQKKGAFYQCAKSNVYGTECEQCISGYYLTTKDKRCITMSNCAKTENGICIECDEGFGYNAKDLECQNNNYVQSEKRKILYKCRRTDEDFSKCAICEDGYDLTKDGLCVDNEHCTVRDNDGVCVKCERLSDEDKAISYCVNEVYGCVKSFVYKGCLVCDNYLNFNHCDKCLDGFTKVKKNQDQGDYYVCESSSD